MRLDHLLSREYSEGGNAGAQTEVDTTGAIRIVAKLQRSETERQRTFEKGIAGKPERVSLCIVFRGEPVMTASGGKTISGEVRRNRAISTVWSRDN